MSEVIQDQLITIPPDNLVAQIYNVVNIVLQFYGLFLNIIADGGVGGGAPVCSGAQVFGTLP